MKQAAMCEYQISFYEFSVGPHGFHCKSRVSDLPKHADPFAPKVVTQSSTKLRREDLRRHRTTPVSANECMVALCHKGKQNVFTIPDLREIRDADIRSQIEDAPKCSLVKAYAPDQHVHFRVPSD